jgi:hypothetical protein
VSAWTPPHKPLKIPPEEIVRLYVEERLSAYDIELQAGISQNLVLRILRGAGVAIRKRSEQKKGKKPVSYQGGKNILLKGNE